MQPSFRESALMGVEGRFLELLKRPDLEAGEIETLLHDPEARRFHAVRLALAAHRRTPRGEALSLVETLFWRDLARISADARVHPEVRRAADTQLARRLPEMATAERVDLARNVGRGSLVLLRRDPDPRVAAALLENRFATEPDVVYIAAQCGRPEVLATIAAHGRWALRRPVREALLANPRLPASAAEPLLERSTDGELEAWRDLAGSPPAIRALAQRILAKRSRAD